LQFVADSSGSVAIRSAAGVVVGRVPSPTMWDARRGLAGGVVAERPLGVRVRPARAAKGSAVRAGVDAAGGSGAVALDLDADAAWLGDPARVFPVTLDPVVDVDPSSDTYVRSDSAVDRSGSNELEFGKRASHPFSG
jgi:hypothetical protein